MPDGIEIWDIWGRRGKPPWPPQRRKPFPAWEWLMGRVPPRAARPLTQAELAGELRQAITPEGTIPYRGREYLKPFLEQVGWELVEPGTFPEMLEPFYRRVPVAPEKEPQPLTASVEQIGGYDLVVYRNEKGDIVQMQNLGRAPAGPDWESLRREQLALAREREELAIAAPARARAESAAMWEAERQRLLQSVQLMGPAGWIRRWELMQQANPFIPPPQPTGEPEMMARRFAAEHGMSPEAAVQTAWRYEQNPEDPEFANVPLKARQELAWVAMEATGPPPEPARPTTPPAPAWLPEFVPGQVAGRPITSEPMLTPSPQLWARTPPSVRQGLYGYGEWVGHRPLEDVIRHMEMMLPRAPIGAGQQVWMPARQFA